MGTAVQLRGDRRKLTNEVSFRILLMLSTNALLVFKIVHIHALKMSQ